MHIFAVHVHGHGAGVGDHRQAHRCGGYARLAVAPAGAPLAGTVYVGHAAGADLTAITADTFTVSSIRAGTRPSQLAVAPAGTPTAGTLYTTNFVDNTISVVPPGRTTGDTIPVADHPSTIQIVPTA